MINVQILFNLQIGLLLHLVGDYLLQNDWMAKNKTISYKAAFAHALVYSVPFLFITELKFWAILFGSHFLIDRFRLAEYWIRIINWNWDFENKNYGFNQGKPQFLSLWLLIICDNTFHITINSLCIFYSK